MLTASEVVTSAKAAGLVFWSGVPCSILTPLMNGALASQEIRYVGATNEGEAVALAAGAWLAGRSTAVLFQNSGLGNAINPFATLNVPFRIPTILIVTWRGHPEEKDEPQHRLMGAKLGSFLDALQISHFCLPSSSQDVYSAFAAASERTFRERTMTAIILRNEALRSEELMSPPAFRRHPSVTTDRRTGSVRCVRFNAIEEILRVLPPEALVIATTGRCARELYAIADRPQHFYQVGSMGCASAIGLGVALSSPLPVVVLDGDGAALMRLGNMATIGAHQPRNLIHILFDNGTHESTGGQPTVSPAIDFAGIATACGYAAVDMVDTNSELVSALKAALVKPGPCFIGASIQPDGLRKLPRPSLDPADVADRFRQFVVAASHTHALRQVRGA